MRTHLVHCMLASAASVGLLHMHPVTTAHRACMQRIDTDSRVVLRHTLFHHSLTPMRPCTCTSIISLPSAVSSGFLSLDAHLVRSSLLCTRLTQLPVNICPFVLCNLQDAKKQLVNNGFMHYRSCTLPAIECFPPPFTFSSVLA
jgi:hypothetical protein